MRQCGFEDKLAELGLNRPQIAAAVGNIVGRMAHPGSELATHAWLQQRSALGELIGLDFEAMDLNRLYRASDALYKHREALQDHLFAQAQSTNQVRACQQGLEEIAHLFEARDSLRRVLTQPFIAPAEKQKLIHSAMGEYATPLLERFLNLLVQKRRFDLLPSIAQQFQATGVFDIKRRGAPRPAMPPRNVQMALF